MKKPYCHPKMDVIELRGNICQESVSLPTDPNKEVPPSSGNGAIDGNAGAFSKEQGVQLYEAPFSPKEPLL